ncbi:GNAT family N-acetyltransferase [Peribacillus frigoritolerans]|uniref:GNAT family N-acetyltransferase n=1 Tax=Peribacillus castrilensis TaxID=2897690 RepID=A0AAW9NPJ3_9BACI|nr:GNAT family N-acetyltransferase [Peribacillus castrilensis]
MNLKIRKAGIDDTKLVTDMAAKLLSELRERTVFSSDLFDICEELLSKEGNLYTVFLAFKEEECIGMVTIHGVTSLYATGSMGIIQELYVLPNLRSEGTGDQLIHAAKEHGYKCGWTNIEVGAPHAEKWSRTVSFYKRKDFKEIGPRLRYDLK